MLLASNPVWTLSVEKRAHGGSPMWPRVSVPVGAGLDVDTVEILGYSRGKGDAGVVSDPSEAKASREASADFGTLGIAANGVSRQFGPDEEKALIHGRTRPRPEMDAQREVGVEGCRGRRTGGEVVRCRMGFGDLDGASHNVFKLPD